MGSIYLLVDPFTMQVRYVGQTVQSPAKRLNGHLHSGKRSNPHLWRWVEKVVREGGKPIMRVVETGIDCRDLLDALEREWVVYAHAYGWKILNAGPGGSGNRGKTLSAETRAKMSAARKGRPMSAQTKAKISAAKSGKTNSADAVDRMRKALTGRTLSPEHVENIRKARTGWKFSEETRKKMSESARNRRLTSGTGDQA